MEEKLEIIGRGGGAQEKEERSERRSLPGPRPAPWLVFPFMAKGCKPQQAFYNLCEPENKTCRKLIPEMIGTTYWQKPSHGGWLIMLCDHDEVDYSKFSNRKYGDCFLWNPVSLETIQLPSPLDWLKKSNGEYWIHDCVLTSPPKSTTNHNDDNSLVCFLFRGPLDEEDQYLVYCRAIEEDKQWRSKKLAGYIVDDDNNLSKQVESLLSFKGKLYGMCVNFWHLEIEIKLGSNDDDVDETISIRSFYVNPENFDVPYHSSAESHYMESSNEIFRIDTYYIRRGYKNLITRILVFWLDFSVMAWEKVQSLGDSVLFLGENTTACCSAAELGLKRGCLYYTLSEDQSLYKFEIEDDAITPILPCLKLPTPWSSANWMMMPTTVRVADGRRRIDGIIGKHDEDDNILDAERNKTRINNDEKENHGQKHNGGELEKARPWDILREDMVELIASYLHPVDYGCFRAVCKANRSIIPAQYWRSSSIGIVKSIYFSPWFVISKDNDTIYNFVDPMHNNKKYLMNLPKLLEGATIRFSKGGWLLMSKGRKIIFFYNPFTRVTIQLPILIDIPWLLGMSFSSLPTSSDCVVFGIYEIYIIVITRGNDSWGYYTFENLDLQKFKPCLNNPVFYNRAFHCLDDSGNIGTFSIEDGFIWKVLTKPQGHFHALYPSFLVECDGNLLLVDLGPLGKSIGIFRLDFSKMAWVKVESLGKHMLFISNTTCLSAIAPHSRMENKIYFARLHGEGILFYSLDTGRYHCFESSHSATDFYDTTEWINCTWIEPNRLRPTEQELDWLTV